MAYTDLTIIHLTASELPEAWTNHQLDTLMLAAGDAEIITVSRKPMPAWLSKWAGITQLIDEEPKTVSNIYYQMLRAAREAKTEFIAISEDDTLYPYEHFHSFRPPSDAFAYNKNRIGLFTWGKPTYFYKDRNSNSTLIAPRLLLVDALEERYRKWPDGTPKGITGELGRKNIAEKLGVTDHKCVEFTTDISVLRLDHELGIDELAKSHRKALGLARSYDVPYWGKAVDIVARFK